MEIYYHKIFNRLAHSYIKGMAYQLLALNKSHDELLTLFAWHRVEYSDGGSSYNIIAPHSGWMPMLMTESGQLTSFKSKQIRIPAKPTNDCTHKRNQIQVRNLVKKVILPLHDKKNLGCMFCGMSFGDICPNHSGILSWNRLQFLCSTKKEKKKTRRTSGPHRSQESYKNIFTLKLWFKHRHSCWFQ